MHLRVVPTCLDWLLWPLRFLPAPLRDMLRSRWPEWFLPPNIVLKRQKIGWDEEFDNETAIYRRLAPLQGTVVPVCYGVAHCPPLRLQEPVPWYSLMSEGSVCMRMRPAGGKQRILKACCCIHSGP